MLDRFEKMKPNYKPVLFRAVLKSTKLICSILKSISFTTVAGIRITSNGLKIIVEEMKSVQTSVYIPCDMFDNFELNEHEDDIRFKINLNMLTECLNIFGDEVNPKMKIIYERQDDPLMLILDHEEDDVTVDCKLYTLEDNELLDLNFNTETHTNTIVLKAQDFSNIIHRLDGSCASLEISINSNLSQLKLRTEGLLYDSEIEISSNSDIVEVFRCEKPFKQNYSLTYIKKLERIMSVSHQISLSTGDESGLLGLQLIINLEETNSKLFVEFFTTAFLLQN